MKSDKAIAGKAFASAITLPEHAKRCTGTQAVRRRPQPRRSRQRAGSPGFHPARACLHGHAGSAAPPSATPLATARTRDTHIQLGNVHGAHLLTYSLTACLCGPSMHAHSSGPQPCERGGLARRFSHSARIASHLCAHSALPLQQADTRARAEPVNGSLQLCPLWASSHVAAGPGLPFHMRHDMGIRLIFTRILLLHHTRCPSRCSE